jgi:S-adenosylmethionine:tRNA ribosyltransferase-isomerase
VIAVGTTVVRALETAALAAAIASETTGAGLAARAGWTSHVVTPETGLRVVDGLLTGLHEPRSSHLRMLAAFHDEALLRDCYEAALSHGYLWHEFGDVHLLLP